MTYVSEVMQSWCPNCEEPTFEARQNAETGAFECPCGEVVE